MKDKSLSDQIAEVFCLKWIANAIMFIGTYAMVFMISFAILHLFFEIGWQVSLIGIALLYISYKLLDVVLTGILFFAIVLIILLVPILFS